MPAISNLNIVPFISVDHMMKLVLTVGIDTFLTELATAIEEDFRRWPVFDKTPRVASHSREGVIELMPTSDGTLYGFKYVNGHPKNTHDGRQTVTAFGVLSDVGNGYPASDQGIREKLRIAKPNHNFRCLRTPVNPLKDLLCIRVAEGEGKEANMSVEEIDTLVVGAGQAGVAMSEHLSECGVPHIVLERGRIAERWRSERWDSLVANGPAWHDRFPSLEFSSVGPDGFAPKERVADYFVDYAKHIAAPIRCGVEVTSVRGVEGATSNLSKGYFGLPPDLVCFLDNQFGHHLCGCRRQGPS